MDQSTPPADEAGNAAGAAPEASPPALQALTAEQIETAGEFFKARLVGQPEVVDALTNLLYRQTAYLKRLMEHPGQAPILPDPAVLLFAGGPWGKSLAAQLISLALQPHGFAPFTVLTPLPQDPEGSLNFDPRIFTVPYAVVLVERIEVAQAINARFVVNLAQMLEAGVVSIPDPQTKSVHRIPLGLSTFIFTTSAGEDEIRKMLQSNGRLGFLQAGTPLRRQEAYEAVERVVQKDLTYLPDALLRHVDETVIFRPLATDDLLRIFDTEIEFYRETVFTGKQLALDITPAARSFLFDIASAGLETYGAHALRRTLQRYIDPTIYRSYVRGEISEANLESKVVQVSLDDGALQVAIGDRA